MWTPHLESATLIWYQWKYWNVNEKYIQLLLNQMETILEKIDAKASNMMLNAVMGLILNIKGEYTFWSIVFWLKSKVIKVQFLITHQKCGNNKNEVNATQRYGKWNMWTWTFYCKRSIQF